MGKLYFRYGAMGSSKTANVLMVRFNYLERGKNVLLLKPGVDTRDGSDVIKSRIGLEAECVNAESTLFFFREMFTSDNLIIPYDVVIVDEVQFLSEEDIDTLAEVVDRFDIPVICYGLKTDFKGHLFDGSKRLIEVADVIEEIPTICWCGRKAHFNARIIDGKVVKEGEQLMLGANDKYISLCRKHYKESKWEESL